MSEEENRDWKEFERLFKEFHEALDDENAEKASAAMNSMWVLFHMLLTPMTSPELKELNFFKAPIDFADGGKYLLQFTHVSGPKIRFDKNTNGYQDVKKQESV